MKKISESQFAAMNLIYSRCNPNYFLKSVSILGIKNIELWSGPALYNLMDDQHKNFYQNLKKIMRKYHLKLICFIPEQCTYPLNIASKDKDIQKKTIQYYIEGIKTAAELNGEKVLVTPGFGMYGESEDEGRKRSEEGLRKILKTAVDNRIELVLEILQKPESNLLYCFDTMTWYAGHFHESELNFCLDTVAVSAAGETLEQYFNFFDKRIRHIHLVDGTPTGHLCWGDGTQNIDESVKTLNSFGYDGYITLEFGSTMYFKNPHVHMERGWHYVRERLGGR